MPLFKCYYRLGPFPSLLFGRSRLTRWLLLFAGLWAVDWLISEFLSVPTNDYELGSVKEIRPEDFRRLTINDLIRNVSLPKETILGGKSQEEEGQQFTFQKLKCAAQLQLAKGDRNRFQLCYPPKKQFLEHERERLAYFINGPRDGPFERSFKGILVEGAKLKVFTRHNISTKFPFKPDFVGNFDVKIYTEKGEDADGQPQMGLKDLIDSRDNYHLMEFIKFEMHTQIDQIIFALNIPMFASHMLLRLEHFPYEEFQHLIRRLARSLYFPYSILHGKDVLFVSCMHRYSMYKYSLGGMSPETWTRQRHGLLETGD